MLDPNNDPTLVGQGMTTPAPRASGEAPQDESGRLSAAADELLRYALRTKARTRVADESMHRLVYRMCAAAHAMQLHIEELLIALKARWHALPEVRRAPGYGMDLVLARVVTMCINEFYEMEERRNESA